MSNPKWEIGPVKLVNGCDAVIHRFCENRQRYIGEWTGRCGRFYAAEWRVGGSNALMGIGDPMLDLAPPPKKTVRVRYWLNIDECEGIACFLFREDADRLASVNRIACIEIDREVTEGEGLWARQH